MAIDRQGVQGLPQVQSNGGPGMSGTQTIQVGTPTADRRGGDFLSDLFTAAGSVAQIGTAIMNQNVEDDKVRQMDRALNGLLPSDNATVGGTRAHMLVSLQNKITDQSARLQDDATRFQGTDQEWEQHVLNSRNSVQMQLWQQYPELSGDKDSMRMVTNAFLEQQPKVFAARASAKLEKERVDRQDSMRSRIISVTQGLSGQGLDAAVKQLQQESLTMQLTKPEFEATLSELALSRAAIGDTSLIEGTKGLKDASGLSLYERNGKLQQGAIEGLRVNASLNQASLNSLPILAPPM